MRALFGCGLHPLAELRLQQLEGPDLTGQDFRDVMRLGAPFKIIDDATPFRVEVAKRIAALNAAIGEPVDASVAAADRARIRTQVAREFFAAEHGRAPIDAAELAGQIAKSSRPRAQTVAGFDLTFSPVKSVSTLWAVAEPAVAAAIERAHQAAVNDALTLHRAAGLVHPDRAARDPAGQRAWPGRGRVHPPRQPCRRPGSAHPCRGGEQGADPRRALAVDRRPGVVQGKGCRVGDLQHLPGAAPPRRAGGAVRCASWRRSGQAADQGNRRCRPAVEPALVDPAGPHQPPPRRARHPIPSTIMVDHRHRSKRYTWPSRQRWRPATPSTNPDHSPSSAPPG